VHIQHGAGGWGTGKGADNGGSGWGAGLVIPALLHTAVGHVQLRHPPELSAAAFRRATAAAAGVLVTFLAPSTHFFYVAYSRVLLDWLIS
jgi:hypothetical protein